MDETRRITDETIQLQQGIAKLNAGDASVRGELLNIACKQLMRLTAQIRQELQASSSESSSVESGELFATASARLYEALHATPVKDARHFYQLASLQIRRELIDLCKRTGSSCSPEIDQLAHFYDCLDMLPDAEREVFELIWYHEMSREEVAELLGRDLAEVKQLWRAARLSLHEHLE